MAKPEQKLNKHYTGTGCCNIDLVVGGAKGVKGFPFGNIINIVGDSSSGKTFLANEILATAYHTYGPEKLQWKYDDCESGFSFDTKELYGFEIMPVDPKDRFKSSTVEEAYCNITEFAESLNKDEFGIYVLDSLDGLTSEEQDARAEERIKKHGKGEKLEKGTYGMGKQKYLSQEFFPQLAEFLEKKNVLLIIVSQVRENIDMFSFAKFTRSGGKALQFYCHTVLWLKTITKIAKKSRPIGTVVEAKTSKSKTPRPFRSCTFSFLFAYGLDDIGSAVDYLFNLRGDSGALLKVAQSITWKGQDKTVENLWKFVEENWTGELPKKPSKKAGIMDLIESQSEKSADFKVKFDESFGTPMTRDELLNYIEVENLQQELFDRVEEKWEAVEEEIRPKRKPKYQ